VESANNVQLRIADYIRPLKARWWLIVVAVVVATGGTYAYYARKHNLYESTTLVYYQDPGNIVSGIPSPQQTDRTVIDAATLLDSNAQAEAVAKQIGWQGSPASLLQQVSVGSKTGSDFISISTTAGTAGEAAKIANGFAQSLVASLLNQVTSQIESALAVARSQLAQTARGQAGIVQRADLQSQIDRLQLALRVPTLVAKQVAPARVPTAPSSPKPLRNALFALLISLVAAVALVFGLERFDRRLKTPEEMERAYGRTLLGVLPQSGDPAPTYEAGPGLGQDFREPFRILRTNIELECLDNPPRTIVVSSAVPGEGKSTVVRNLALALREAGLRVVVVDLDLRNPALPGKLDIQPRAGITEVLRHELDLEEAELHVGVALDPFEELFRMRAGNQVWRHGGAKADGAAPSGNGKATRNGIRADDNEITMICSGARPANTPAVLASARLVEVLDDLRERFDVVLIDTAPILAVTDTVPLLRYADASLFVGRLDVTTRDTARRLAEFLERVPDVNVIGIVANGLTRLDASGYGYGYGYGYGAYAQEEPPAPQPKSARKRRTSTKEPA
jgi:non-specific protein-tyrosine kinase